jgi:glucokinase
MKKYIGCDLGGTNLRAGVVDPTNGKILADRSTPALAREGHDAVMERMAALMEQVITDSGLPKSDFGGIGIGVPGLLDLKNGLTLFLPNLSGHWKRVPLRDTIAGKVGLPTFLLNDVRSITYGEWKFGGGRGVDSMACYAIGTGIGGGIVVGGKLHMGVDGTAGELGHQTIDFNGPKCGCGSNGCVEAYASGPAIAAAGLKVVTQGATTKIGELAGYDLNKIDAALIAKAANMGDEIARDIYERAGEALGVAISNTLVTIDAHKIVIGGGVAQAGDLLLNPIRRTIKKRVFIMPLEEVEVALAELGGNAGIIGAAAFAASQVEGE